MPAKTQLTETQTLVLAAACARPGRSVLPITAPGVRGGAASNVIAGLLGRGLAEERIADAEPGPDEILRRDDDGRAVLLVASDAAVEILGGVGELDPEDDDAPEPETPGGDVADDEAEAPSIETGDPTPTPTPTIRAGTKQATLIAMLRADGGATLDEIVAATGWQPHYADPRIMPM
ncbi:MAG: DUF3489 domain-containing protein [Paracoccaceae bacterium]